MTTLRILLVEDHKTWKKILKSRVAQVLNEMDCEHEIRTTKSFDRAWSSLANEGPWHLLITDIGLGDRRTSPQKQGIQLTSRAKELEIPCIVVSGTLVVTKADVRNLLVEYKISDYFSKADFDDALFARVVEQVIRGAAKKTDSSPPEPSASTTPGQQVSGSGASASDSSVASGAEGISVGRDVKGSVIVVKGGSINITTDEPPESGIKQPKE